ncbi:MAG: TfoX/Sxy family DNA transformation protein [Bacteroidota bacterium]
MASDYKTIKKNLINAGVTPHLNIFYSIEMGLQGKSWNEITANEKNEIQKILDGA